MRQERISKRPVRRRQGGGGAPDPLVPMPGKPESAKRSVAKADDLLRRLDRLISP